MSTTGATTTSKKKKKIYVLQKPFFEHYSEKNCLLILSRYAKKQLLSNLGQNLACKAVFDIEEKNKKTVQQVLVAKIQPSHQKKIKKSASRCALP